MMLRTTMTIASALALAAPLAAAADPISYYKPPSIVKIGTTTVKTSGAGKVIVKVLVKADGSFKVIGVIKTTNAADNAAALAIAGTSTYAPATNGSTKQLAFYDFTLNFKDTGQLADSGSSGSLAKFEAELSANNYTEAQTGLKAYVAEHPTDAKAQLDLGVADTYLNDYAGGAEAFTKSGTVPSAYRAVAAKAYVSYAVSLLNAKNVPDGLAAAKVALNFAEGFASEDTLGVAELESGDAASAVTNLSKAHDLAKADANVPVASRVDNDVHLTQAYVANGNLDEAQKAASEAQSLDPKSVSLTSSFLAKYYVDKAEDASKSEKYSDAAALYIQAAGAFPSQAATMYVNATFAYMKLTPAATDKAKDAADKALAADPNNAAAQFAEGYVLAGMGKKSDAGPYLDKADTLAKAASNASLVEQIEHLQKQLAN